MSGIKLMFFKIDMRFFCRSPFPVQHRNFPRKTLMLMSMLLRICFMLFILVIVVIPSHCRYLKRYATYQNNDSLTK
jgi:hypothetical protein